MNIANTLLFSFIVYITFAFSIEPGKYRTTYLDDDVWQWDQWEIVNDSVSKRLSWDGECYNYESIIKTKITTDSIYQFSERRRYVSDSCAAGWSEWKDNDDLFDYKILEDNENDFLLENGDYQLRFTKEDNTVSISKAPNLIPAQNNMYSINGVLQRAPSTTTTILFKNRQI